MTVLPACRSCRADGLVPFLDLGTTPLADALVEEARLDEPEDRFPLEVAFCPSCALVQVLEEVPAEKLFVDNYHYYSSFSDDLLAHARAHAEQLTARRGLGPGSFVVELASNDGYLLRNFAAMGVPVLGIDPSPGPAEAALAAGIPTLVEFFGIELARRLVSEGRRADVIIANNVMAHVPDLNGFVAGMAELLAPGGIITVENPYVGDLIEHCEFDTIYHEHHCYFSCTAVDALMRRNGLWLNDIDYFPDLHGGTLRWSIGHEQLRTPRLEEQLEVERAEGLTEAAYYLGFADRVAAIQRRLVELLQERRAAGRRIAAYGAAAKGATLLNSSGIGTDLVEFVVDRNPAKQGKFMPGTRQPILSTSALEQERPDDVLLLAWNFKDEIVRQQAAHLERGGHFIVPVPWPEVIG